MVVDVTLSPQFNASVPRVLIDPRSRPGPGMRWAVSPDRQRILVNRATESTAITPYTLVQNWTAALGR
jgi:hypothetical protein